MEKNRRKDTTYITFKNIAVPINRFIPDIEYDCETFEKVLREIIREELVKLLKEMP
jgi:hypothetical protein